MVDISSSELSPSGHLEVFNTPWRRNLRKVINFVGWPIVLLLLFVGLSSLYGRVSGMNAVFARDVANPELGLNQFDVRYIQHYVTAAIHLVFGFIVYVFAPFQFMTSIRKRFISFHRWTGRAWLIGAAIAGFTGAFFGVVWPFTGHQEFGLLQTAINAIIGPYTLFCLYQAYRNIRARNFGAHREWMIRSFALMLGVATQRVLMLILIPLTGLPMEAMFASMMVLGMIINIGVAELWITLTRTPGSGHRHWRDLDKKNA